MTEREVFPTVHCMNTNDMSEEDTDCSCEDCHNEEVNEFLFILCAGMAKIWPKAQGGEFSLRVDDSEGNPVVEFGGKVPRMRCQIGNN